MIDNLPKHVGVIIDGNRRWAEKRGLTPIEGHKRGYENLKKLMDSVRKYDIPFWTIYAFSSENWNRHEKEVDGLMNLLKWSMDNEIKKFADDNWKILFLGSDKRISPNIVRKMRKIEKVTADHTGGTISACINYGGQEEIVEAANRALDKKQSITLSSIEQNLYQPTLPPLDLIIRSSGEERLSNFMLWRAAYSELYFTDKLWPEVTGEDLDNALREYAVRKRRFGK